jgi:hypothetical protein
MMDADSGGQVPALIAVFKLAGTTVAFAQRGDPDLRAKARHTIRVNKIQGECRESKRR